MTSQSASMDTGEPIAEVCEDTDSSPLSAYRFWLLCAAPSIPFLLVHFYHKLDSWDALTIPLAFLLVGLLYRQRSEGSRSQPSARAHLWILAAAWLSVLIAVLIAYPWFSAVGFLLVAGVWLANTRGTLRPTLVYLTAPLVGAVGLPAAVDEILRGWIHRTSGWFASIFLDFCEIPHAINGSFIQLTDSEVLVGDVVSGLLTIDLVVFLAFAWFAVKRMSLWLLPYYAAAALLITITLDSLLIFASILASESLGWDPGTGWFGAVGTLLGILIAVGLLLSFHQLATLMFHHVEDDPEADGNPLLNLWNRFSWMTENRADEEMSRGRSRRGRAPEARVPGDPIAKPLWTAMLSVAGVLVLLSVVQGFRSPSSATAQAMLSEPLVQPDEELFDSVASAIDWDDYDISELEPEATAGPQHAVWQGTYDGATVTMQLTQPISGWLEASRSYVNRGWMLLSRDTVAADGDGSNQGDDQATEMVFARLRHPGNNTEPLEAYLHFATVSADGSLQPPPTAASSLGKRIKRRLGIPDAEDAEPAALLHLWAVSDQKLSAAQVRGLRGEFVRHRQALAEMLSDNPLSASTELGEPAR